MYQSLLVKVLVALVVAIPLLGSTGCGPSTEGEGGFRPVMEWVVGFATATGEFVMEKATTFAQAVSRAWTAFWGAATVGGVIVDENDPLQGVFDGTLQCSVEWGSTGSSEASNRMAIELDRPRMVRDSADVENWELAPEERQRIEELRDLLLQSR